MMKPRVAASARFLFRIRGGIFPDERGSRLASRLRHRRDRAAQWRHATSPARPGTWKDRAFEWLTRLFALLVFSILGAILISLVAGSMLSLERNGVAFLWSDAWDPVKESFGALVPIYGTLLTSFIALLIGVPVSFGIALFLTELSPTWLKRPARHRDRAAGGDSLDHLRDVGPVRVRAALPDSPAAARSSHARRRAGHRRRCSTARRSASACSPRASSSRSW
jgi:hypothetical protein